MRKLMFVLAAVLALGVIAAGCGSDDDSSDSKSEITKEEFLAQGNAICDAGNKVTDAAGEALGANPTEEQINAAITDTVLPSIEGQLADLRDLGIPEGEEDAVNKFYDDADAAIESAKDDPTVLTDGDVFADVNEQAKAIGLTSCGSE